MGTAERQVGFRKDSCGAGETGKPRLTTVAEEDDEVRNISFMLTTDQILDRSKTVTRRNGWRHVRVGDLLQGCVKCMGLRKGEQIQKLAVIRVVSVRQEPLNRMLIDPAYGRSECFKEGFPQMSPAGFVRMFRDHHSSITVSTPVTRIEFEYVDEVAA
ncbi:MAG: hypothetical protein Fues2KO_47520 [Fuerstiella sp.]